MKPAVFHPFVEQELVDAAAYYEEQKTGLGLEYLDEMVLSLVIEEIVAARTLQQPAGLTAFSCRRS